MQMHFLKIVHSLKQLNERVFLIYKQKTQNYSKIQRITQQTVAQFVLLLAIDLKTLNRTNLPCGGNRQKTVRSHIAKNTLLQTAFLPTG